MAQLTTCQICARAIKSKSGLIAHHGYRRPGDGWQTDSCMGARFRPYEVACDALPPAIKAIQAHITHTEQVLAAWKAEPPQGIRCERELRDRRNSYDRYRTEWTVIKPIDFDPAAPLPKEKNQDAWDYHPTPRYYYGYRPCDVMNYAHVYAGRLAGFARDIEASKQTLAYFEQRLADWTAPAGVVV